jgi:hypothetical protein
VTTTSGVMDGDGLGVGVAVDGTDVAVGVGGGVAVVVGVPPPGCGICVGVAVAPWVGVTPRVKVGTSVASCAVAVLMRIGEGDAGPCCMTMRIMSAKKTRPMLAAMSAPKAARGGGTCDGGIMRDYSLVGFL